MGLFRKKPALVDAEQFTDPRNPPRGVTVKWWDSSMTAWRAYVTTIQGQEVPVGLDEWIVSEGDGVHFYPIADKVFLQTYEPVLSARIGK